MTNMFDSNDILRLFQEGKVDADTLTKDFTAALNKAIADKKAADEAAEAKRKAEELRDSLQKAKDKAKLRDADKIAADLVKFLETYYNVKAGGEGITGKMLVDLMDGSVSMANRLDEMEKRFQEIEKNFPMLDMFSHKDPIAEFLKNYGL